MGSPEDEPFRGDDEVLHRVRITRAFFIQDTEVRRGRWQAIAGEDPPIEEGVCPEVQCPVRRITWGEAIEFANRMSDSDPDLERCYELGPCIPVAMQAPPICARGTVGFRGLDCNGWRLPTEAEWEYAARAGTQTAFWSGELDEQVEPCEEEARALAGVAWYCANTDRPRGTSRALSRWPNRWGLYDVHGNVGEWVYDWKMPNFEWFRDEDGQLPDLLIDPIVPHSLPDDFEPMPISKGERGGRFYHEPHDLRSARRAGNGPWVRLDGTGVRLVRTVPSPR